MHIPKHQGPCDVQNSYILNKFLPEAAAEVAELSLCKAWQPLETEAKLGNLCFQRLKICRISKNFLKYLSSTPQEANLVILFPMIFMFRPCGNISHEHHAS